jgi:hypothetical protein
MNELIFFVHVFLCAINSFNDEAFIKKINVRCTKKYVKDKRK